MLRTIFFFLFFTLYLLMSMLFLIPYFFLWLIRRNDLKKKFLYASAAGWARAMVWAIGGRIHVNGFENIPEETVLIVGNHQSNADIVIVLATIPKLIGFIAKKELGLIPILNMWMYLLRCIFMDRKSMKKSSEAIHLGVDYLKQGNSLVIFPEGHRSKGGPMARFKPGSLKLATLSGVKILPITINGSYQIFEKNKGLITAADVKFTIHKPLDPADYSEEKTTNLVAELEKVISSAL